MPRPRATCYSPTLFMPSPASTTRCGHCLCAPIKSGISAAASPAPLLPLLPSSCHCCLSTFSYPSPFSLLYVCMQQRTWEPPKISLHAIWGRRFKGGAEGKEAKEGERVLAGRERGNFRIRRPICKISNHKLPNQNLYSVMFSLCSAGS